MKKLRRLFHESLDASAVSLSPEESHHAAHVLRLAPGDCVEVFDGRGSSRAGRVEAISRHKVSVALAGEPIVSTVPRPAITLAVTPPKGQRMDTLLQMSQEMAINEVIPVVGENSDSPSRRENARERWRRVIIAAAKQSGTNFFIKIAPREELESLFARAGQWDIAIVCHPGEQLPSLRRVLQECSIPGSALVVVGPEGGLSQREITAAQDAGCFLGRLPAPTLRVETAAVFALCALCYQFR